MSELWGDLVAAAVLGVERRPFAVPSAEGALGVTLARIAQGDREAALLSAAAATALYRRAGWSPPVADEPPPAPCPHDPQPVCPPRAAQRFSLLVEGPHRALLPEWLAALAASGRRLPDVLLPDLLEVARSSPDVRTYVTQVAGLRGRWLAEQNPSWGMIAELFRADAHDPAQRAVWRADIESAWQGGSAALRAALLSKARAVDPAFGRELLGSTWGSDKADDRSALLQRLAAGLSMEDESLLESALDDRSQQVRQVAVKLLLQLPESRLVARMQERVVPLLSWTPAEKPRMLGLRPGQPARIEVRLPAECDKAMQRDGVDPKPASRSETLGERGWWLRQMLRSVPPSVWVQRWDVTPEQLLDAAAGGEWDWLLRTAWGEAALTFGDRAWAEVLLRRDPAQAPQFAVLPPERQERWLLDTLARNAAAVHEAAVLDLLRQYDRPWSLQLSRAFLGALYQHMRSAPNSYDYALRGSLTDQFSRQMPPEIAPEIAAGWPADQRVREQWQGVIDRLLVTLQFRHDMLRELS